MRSNKKFYTSKGSTQVGLYSFVFTKRISIFAVCFLFVSFFIQPFHQALANEAVAEEMPVEVLPDEVAEQLPSPAVEEEVEEPAQTETEEVEQVASTETEETTDSAGDTNDTESNSSDDTETSSDINEETIDSSNNQSASSTTSSSVDENEDSSSTTSTSSASSNTGTTQTSSSTSSSTSTNSGGSGQTTGNQNNTASSTNNGTGDTNATTTDSGTSSSTSTTTNSNTGGNTTADDNNQTVDDTVPPTDNTPTDSSSDSTDDDTSSSTEDDLIDNEKIEEGVNGLVDEVVNEVVNLTRQLVTEENYYQFSRQSCVPVGDGTFHCSTNTDGPLDPGNAIYAERDNDGDTEIYMRTSKGEIKQLTDNDYDDSSPDIHLASMEAVWQRLIDGRYQIISYDLNTREETQLTFSRNNSMEPKISAEGIVWQAWDGNDWEVMFFDGQFTDQITTNEIQDVTPVIEDGYILWSVLGGEKAEARVYSLESQEMLTIQGHEGGSIANPRFVLVYDTKFDNGDIVTQGFDPVTGLAQPLAAKPADLPFDIPEPDPVGEIRALIQNKSVHDENEILVVPSGDTDNDLNLASTSATSTDTLLVDVSPDDTITDNATTTDLVFELDEYDLVITDNASSTDSEINYTELAPEVLEAIATSTPATVVNIQASSTQP